MIVFLGLFTTKTTGKTHPKVYQQDCDHHAFCETIRSRVEPLSVEVPCVQVQVLWPSSPYSIKMLLTKWSLLTSVSYNGVCVARWLYRGGQTYLRMCTELRDIYNK